MNRHKDLATFVREACRRRGISLGAASKEMGRSRNWLERIANYGIKSPRPEACRDIARYFNEDPNYIFELAGYISPPPSSTPILDEIVSIIRLLDYDDRYTLLEHARLLKFRANATLEEITFPEIPGIDWAELDSIFAQELAKFMEDEPTTIPTWIEALSILPEKGVELLLINIRGHVFLRDELETQEVIRIWTKLARQLRK